MQEGIIIKIPTGSEPLAIRQRWLYLRFVFEDQPDGDYSVDVITGERLAQTGPEYLVPEAEAYRIMDHQRPGLADFYRQHTHPRVQGWDFSFREDEIHFLEGTAEAWG